MYVTDIIRTICEDLGIEMNDAPTVIPDGSLKMSTYDIDKNEIYINPNKDGGLIIHDIAHELRHAWQHQMAEVDGHPEYIAMFNEYKSYDYLDNKVEYNLQPLEIDANAYARLFTKEKYGIIIGDTKAEEIVEEAIKARIDEIRRERELKKNP